MTDIALGIVILLLILVDWRRRVWKLRAFTEIKAHIVTVKRFNLEIKRMDGVFKLATKIVDGQTQWPEIIEEKK